MIVSKSKLQLVLISVLTAIGFFNCKPESKKNKENEIEIEIADTGQEWVDKFIKGYQAFEENQNLEAAELLFEAIEAMPKKNWDSYFMVATIFATNNEKDKAFLALHKAIASGLRDSVLLVTYPQLAPLRDDAKWPEVLTNFTQSKAVYNQNIENPDILTVLEEMWAKDQQALSKYQEDIKSLNENASYEDHDKLFEPIEIQWELNRKRLDSIIEIHGWPGNRLVGEEGAKLAWAIPQHHPDVFYKEKCLNLLEGATQKNDVDPNHYAELHDRIARETWRKQKYGASMGEKSPYPIKDPVNVNRRRAKLGLVEPVEIYALYHGVDYTPPTEAQAKEQEKIAREKAQQHYSKFEGFWNKNQIDSTNNSIAKAIDFHGDISDKQLFEAALKLAQVDNDRSKRISIKILKVLIWRRWEMRENILTKKEFKILHKNPEWSKIKQLLSRSQR